MSLTSPFPEGCVARVVALAGIACILVLLLGCPAEDPQPSPSPTPTPEPPSVVEPLKFPLRVDGPNFVNADGSPAWVLGGIGCCWDPVESGWPLASDTLLEQLAANHGNLVHIRLGPFNASLYEGPQFQPSPEFFDRVRHVLSKAHSLGIAVEVDVIDAWAMKRGTQKNFYGWDCSTTHRFPTDAQLDWVERVVSHTAAFENVIYQAANESFECKPEPIWELAILDALKTGAPERIVGTNSQNPDIERHFDYVNRHGCEPQAGPIEGLPTATNEFNGCQWQDMGAAAWWEDRSRSARRQGTTFHLWRSNMPDPAWRDALARLKRWREGGA